MTNQPCDVPVLLVLNVDDCRSKFSVTYQPSGLCILVIQWERERRREVGVRSGASCSVQKGVRLFPRGAYILNSVSSLPDRVVFLIHHPRRRPIIIPNPPPRREKNRVPFPEKSLEVKVWRHLVTGGGYQILFARLSRDIPRLLVDFTATNMSQPSLRVLRVSRADADRDSQGSPSNETQRISATGKVESWKGTEDKGKTKASDIHHHRFTFKLEKLSEDLPAVKNLFFISSKSLPVYILWLPRHLFATKLRFVTSVATHFHCEARGARFPFSSLSLWNTVKGEVLSKAATSSMERDTCIARQKGMMNVRHGYMHACAHAPASLGMCPFVLIMCRSRGGRHSLIFTAMQVTVWGKK